jgi:L-threonylcarbamoyladenylate synthase
VSAALDSGQANALEACVAGGGVAVIPTDTVYGVCCDPDNERAAEALYRLKRRSPARACAVMFFAVEAALRALAELRPRERLALQALLPGPVTVLLPNRELRFAPACRADPASFGLRVPRLGERLAALASMALPVMQSSANISGDPDARAFAEVPSSILERAQLALDGGELPGTPSTVIDLRDFDGEGRWHVLRDGALPRGAVEETFASLS